MTENTANRVSYQKIGNGTYRVVGAIRRSALTGRVIVKPRTTTDPAPAKPPSHSTR